MRVLLAMLLVIGCSSPAPVTTTNATETSAPRPAEPSGPRVIFPDGFVVKVEIAADGETRAQGLMFRDHLPAGEGMLFFFPADDVFSFWMKNTLIPLDMIWVDSSQRIVGIKANVPPCKVPDCPSYGPGVSARYVLEVAGGEAAKHSLKVGDPLRFVETDHVLPQ
jgi:uncharacterized membrane protein (UPF0127 family)